MDNATKILSELDWDNRLRSLDLSVKVERFRNDKVKEAEELATKFNDNQNPDPEKYKAFNSKLKMIFMMKLKESGAKEEALKRVDGKLNVTGHEKNPEIQLYWFTLNIPERLKEETLKTDIEEYLRNYGRAKYIEPVYEGLAKANNTFARTLFDKYKANYNPRVVENLKKIIFKATVNTS